jgi:TatD DNase family protein
MEFIDTHSHLYLSQFSEDIEHCIERCHKNNVVKVVLPNIDSTTIQPIIELKEKSGNLFLSVIGLHPTHVKEDFEKELQTIFNTFQQNQHIGIGEIGIDLYWDKTYFEEQKYSFEFQVRFAIENDLPVIIHARDSFDEIIEVLSKINSQTFKGIFHAFPGDYFQAMKVIEMGFAIGIGGVLTFKNSHLPEVVKQVDLNHIVLETDSPYLAPVPYRGKRNESSYIPIIAEKIATLTDKEIEEVALKTTNKAREIFRL